MKASVTVFMILLVVTLLPLAFGADPDLVLYMPFEEGTGEVVNDLSGHGNNGTLIDSVEWTNDGKYGKALKFTRGYVEIKSSDTLQPDESDFTIEAWFMGDPASESWARIVDKFYGTGYCIGRVGSELRVGAEMGGNANSFGSTTMVFDKKWHHVALVRDVKEIEGLLIAWLYIYVDGTLENNTIPPNVNLHNWDTTPVRIGCGINCCTEDAAVDLFFVGTIDEVAIYRRALTADEVKRDMGGIIAVSVDPAGTVVTKWGTIKSRD
jgi:hypothetical protein